MDAPEWSDYWTRVAASIGTVPPAGEPAVGYWSATALINVQYPPFVIANRGEERAATMMRAALDAAETVATLSR
jgi:hypothetical protein